MNLKKNRNILQFVEVAKEFCALLESEPHNMEKWTKEILSTLATLYASAHHLPDVEIKNSDFDEESYRVSGKEWKHIFHSIGSILGEQRYYWEYFDPSEPISSEPEATVGDLADDLADIYRDLIPGLRAWDVVNDAVLPEIIFNWKEPMFGLHWGDHALSAMRVLHPIYFRRGIQK